MELVRIISQHRRDFKGVYKCEKCGNEEEHGGYDDRNFHDNVTPAWKCQKCGKSTTDLKIKPKFVGTKYHDYEVI